MSTVRAGTITTRRLRKRRLCGLSSLSMLLLIPSAMGGVAEITWSHTNNEYPTAMTTDDQGNTFVVGCVTPSDRSDHSFVAKYSPLGQLLWRQELNQITRNCATAVDSSQQSVYVTGTIDGTQEDTDVFITKIDTNGVLVWHQMFGTPYNDVPMTIRSHIVSSTSTSWIYIGGSSDGDMALGVDSPSNCLVEGTSENCEDGFVIQLTETDGAMQWIHHVRSTSTDRVFSIEIQPITGDVMMVGETKGNLRDQATSHAHAGDVFVRRIASDSGQSVWTTQLGDASSSVADLCVIPSSSNTIRGRCALTLHTTELSVTGSTYGILSTFPDQINKFRQLCAPAQWRLLVDGECLQMFVARLNMENGVIQWIHQLVERTHITSQDIVAITDNSATHSEDIALLGLTDAGFLSAESMEQLLVLRVSQDGNMLWMKDTGLEGEDHSVAITTHKYGPDPPAINILGYGSRLRKRDNINIETYIRRFMTSTGSQVAMCVDHAEFRNNITTVSQQITDRVLVVVPIDRVTINSCPGPMSVQFHTAPVLETPTRKPAIINTHFVITEGSLLFSPDQKSASIVIEILPHTIDYRNATNEAGSRYLFLVLESSLIDVQVMKPGGSTLLEIVLTLPPITVAANGAMWQEISTIFLVFVVGGLLLVLSIGRFCWRRCFRRAKVFQYKMLHIRRRKSDLNDDTTLLDPVTPVSRSNFHSTPVKSAIKAKPDVTTHLTRTPSIDVDEDDAEELRSHLQEIQQLNQSLENLLVTHHGRRASLTKKSKARALSSTASGVLQTKKRIV